MPSRLNEGKENVPGQKRKKVGPSQKKKFQELWGQKPGQTVSTRGVQTSGRIKSITVGGASGKTIFYSELYQGGE